MPSGQSHFALPSYGNTCGTPFRTPRTVVQPYQRFRAVHCHRENKVCLGRHTWGAMPVLGLGGVPAAVLSYAASLALRRRPCSITFRCQVFRRGRLPSLVLFDQQFRLLHELLLLSIYEVKYTTLNPIQLPTTPSAEYALVNINGRNS